MKRFRVRNIIVLYLLPLALWAQGTYYTGIDTGAATFVADLHDLINPHTKISYSQFDETNIANFASRDTIGGNKVVTCVYSGENYVYSGTFAWVTFSREHTFCHSWMPTNPADSPELPEYTDQHHLFPTNQNNANGRRSNHPLGEVTSISYQYLEGKLGTNSSGETVYEPRESHKGDAARALLYMALCYHGVNGKDWSFNYLNTVTLPALSEAAQDVDLLIQWHNQDPPDDWEEARNEYIYSIQGNRNPFVDHPEYVNVIDFNTLTKKTSGTTTSSSGCISISSTTFSYTENFNTLLNSGTTNAWTDTVTVNSWYSNRTTYSTGTGSSNSGALYSFGSASSAERSLGSVASGSTSTMYYAVRFVNNTGSTITSIPVQYTGKQWRNGGNITPQSLTFEYKINASSITDAAGWTAVSALDFTGPVATASAAALDGNAVENKTTVASTISLSLLNGQEIWFRWTDVNDSGNDHGLSVDEFSLNPSGSMLPVELTSFTGISTGNRVTLNWCTATEVNNFGFEIQRSDAGSQRSAMMSHSERSEESSAWAKIGFVAGSGTTNASKEYSFTDKNLKGGRYSYRLKQIDNDGKFEYSQDVEVEISQVPQIFALMQNYPNPFNPVTTIGFTLQVSGFTTLKVYDAVGREVATLVDDLKEPGTYSVQFDGSALSSGIYFYRLHSGSFSSVKRMTIIR